jgi:hypothetical protein
MPNDPTGIGGHLGSAFEWHVIGKGAGFSP